MQIEIAKNCGLCGGCLNAINTVKKTLKSKNNIVIFKPIVHNEKVNFMLEKSGAKIVENIDEIKNNEIVIIRTHGEPKNIFEIFEKRKIKYIDCTCPVVKKIHDKVDKWSNLGYKIIIIGKQCHPEVVATAGYCKTKPIIVSSMDGLHEIDFLKPEKYYIVCQTTFNIFEANRIFEELEVISKKCNIEIVIDNTLCNMQQIINNSSVELAKKSDLMIVIGGKDSSNSHELYENVKKYTTAIYISDIENWKDCFCKNNIKLENKMKIGITTGASTMKEDAITLKEMILAELKTQHPPAMQ